jgi:hypothetical protein
MRDTKLLDRHIPVVIFKKMLEGESQESILRLIGSEKMGKSRILREFYYISKNDYIASCALIDLRSKLQSYSELMYGVIEQLGHENFQRYISLQEQFSDQRAVVVSRLGMLFSNLVIRNEQNMKVEETQRLQLTTAFLLDLESLQSIKPVILLFDAFEQGNETTKLWITEQLLIGLCQLPNVHVVIAGRDLPEPLISYNNKCKTHELLPVELDAHLAYCHELGVNLNEPTIIAFVAAFDGNPGLFVEYTSKFIKESIDV